MQRKDDRGQAGCAGATLSDATRPYHSLTPLGYALPHVTLRQVGLQALPVARAASPRAGILAIASRCWP